MFTQILSQIELSLNWDQGQRPGRPKHSVLQISSSGKYCALSDEPLLMISLKLSEPCLSGEDAPVRAGHPLLSLVIDELPVTYPQGVYQRVSTFERSSDYILFARAGGARPTILLNTMGARCSLLNILTEIDSVTGNGTCHQQRALISSVSLTRPQRALLGPKRKLFCSTNLQSTILGHVHTPPYL